MAQAKTTKFGDFLIMMGDGASPETFEAVECGLKSKGFSQQVTTQDTDVPDCNDPDAITYTERDATSRSGSISGGGVMDSDVFETFEAALGVSKNYRIYPMGSNGGYYEGAFILTKFDNAVNRGERVNVDMGWDSDGPYVWNAAS